MIYYCIVSYDIVIFNLGWWSRGMIPPLQGGDQEFKSPPAHYFISNSIFMMRLFTL